MFDPDRWGLADEAVARLGDDLYQFWERYRPCFRTRTRDTSEQAYVFMRGQLTMDDHRNYANIDRRLTGGDGQGMQQFMTDSPWPGVRVCDQIQADIRAEPTLQHGGLLILDECADEKAGTQSVGRVASIMAAWGKWICAKWQPAWCMPTRSTPSGP